MIETVALSIILGAVLILQEIHHSKERAELLQRIQAPEQAVVTHAVQSENLTFPVPFDDDDEAFEAMRARDA